MYEYIKGTIADINPGFISLDNNGIGYKIYVSNPYSFEVGKEYKVYLYQQVREDENSLYGFKTIEERDLFLKLINVKGLGPKMALPLFSSGSLDGIIDAIERENILYLKKFPKIGDKVARQIILDLKGKLVSKKDDVIVKDDELVEALSALGYKNADINKVLPKIDKSLAIEEKIKEALKLLLK
ncbi:MAG: Holliday junction branch migration protein RuvA [Bacilli bacterium]|nr:Holliday junction branch migration protein RuvA [Bacilli bacterium]